MAAIMADTEFYRRTRLALDAFRRDTPYFLTRHHLDSFDHFARVRVPDIMRSIPWTIVKTGAAVLPDAGPAPAPAPAPAPVPVDGAGEPVDESEGEGKGKGKGKGSARRQDGGEAGAKAGDGKTTVITLHIGGRDGSRIFLDRPTMLSDGGAQPRPLLPNEARLKGLTYASNLYADVVVEYAVDGKPLGETTFPAHRLGLVPIMLHSSLCVLRDLPRAARVEAGECPYDLGGYFVVDGREKVIVSQEEAAVNRLFFTQLGEPAGGAADHVAYRAYLRSVPARGAQFAKLITFKVLGPSLRHSRDAGRRAQVNAIVVNVPYIAGTFGAGANTGGGARAQAASRGRPMDIPLFVLFRALGVESDRDILRHVVYDEAAPGAAAMVDFLRASVLAAGGAAGVYDQTAAVEALRWGTRYESVDNLKRVLEADVLPHAGEDFASKALYLGYLVRRLVRVCLGAAAADSRDDFVNRRLKLSGFLLADLFRDWWLRFRQASLDLLDQEYFYGPWKNTKNLTALVNPTNVRRLLNAAVIDEGMLASMKGKWNFDPKARAGQDFSKDGVVQELGRVSYFSYVSYVRRVNHDMDRALKLVEPRKLQPSQWGWVCPVESPDGHSIGLLKHLALMCHVTSATSPAPLLARLRTAGLLIDHRALVGDLPRLARAAKLFANDRWVGVTFEPVRTVALLRHLRRAAFRSGSGSGSGSGARYASVHWDVVENEIRLQTDEGRCCRPLYRVGRRDRRVPLPLPLPLPLTAASAAAAAAAAAAPLVWESLLQPATASDKSRKRSAAAADNDGDDDDDNEVRAWDDDGAAVEYIDVAETANALIAVTAADVARHPERRYTHCELHAATALSAVTAALPLMNHQNAAYTALSLAQTKQAIGVYATNFAARMDTAAYVLHYAQRPLVGTGFADWLCEGRLVHGENLIVAIASYTGYNQDDGFVLNRDSCERGMFNLTHFHAVTHEETGGFGAGEDRIVFANPLRLEEDGHAVRGVRFGRYDTLDASGLPREDSFVDEDDVLVGRVLVSREDPAAAADAAAAAAAGVPDAAGIAAAGSQRVARADADPAAAAARLVYTDLSVQVDRGAAGVVDHVYVHRDAARGGGNRTARVSLRQVRVPELGDKLGSRFAQKGTVGMLLRATDMPFSHASGLVPDILVNPNAFPKRMTVGHLLECLLAKACCAQGTRANADCFEPRGGEDVGAALESLGALGLQRHGDEVMYNGRTGEQMECSVFLGPNYFGRLKHMAEDKINWRGGDGPVTALTRQPTKGRSAHGGLRVGEMEQQCMLAHGLSAGLKEAFMERSDGTTAQVDRRSGKPALAANPGLGLLRSIDEADGNRDFATVAVPYSFQLLQHELATMNIDARLVVDQERPANPAADAGGVASDDEEGDEEGQVVQSDLASDLASDVPESDDDEPEQVESDAGSATD
jgi:DNA-directed RNA polymerase II subunit RPB2